MRNTLLALSFLIALSACTQQAEQTEQTEPVRAPENTVEAAPVKIASSLNEELFATRLLMTDFSESDVSQGALLLSEWSSDKMKWSELQNEPLGKYGLVMKDPDSQRGKRLCASGQIIEIVADSSLPSKVYIGGMVDGEFHIYRFVAVGSTGDIVAGSFARFCGIITGKNDYSNSAGGAAHAVHLVGMFDLPENKKASNL